MAWRFYERDVDGCNVVSMNGGSARGMEIWAVHRWEAVIHSCRMTLALKDVAGKVTECQCFT